MDLLKVLLENAGTASQLGRAVGLDSKTTTSLIGQLLPALTRGMENNLKQTGGLESLTKALQSGRHQQYLDDPSILGLDDTRRDGNGILGHLLGSKDASRQLADQVSGNSGVDSSLIKKLLPLVASLAMGALSKQTNAGARLQDNDAGDLLGGLLGGGSGLEILGNLAKKLL